MRLTDKLINDIRNVMLNRYGLKISKDVVLQTFDGHLWDNMTCHTDENPEFETTSREMYASNLTRLFSKEHDEWPCYSDHWTDAQVCTLRDEIQQGIDALHVKISVS